MPPPNLPVPTHPADQSTQLLLELLAQTGTLGAQIASLQTSAQHIISQQTKDEQSRAAIYARLTTLDVESAKQNELLERIAPLVDAHERERHQLQGGLVVGRWLMMAGSGIVGAIAAMVLQWIGRKFG